MQSQSAEMEILDLLWQSLKGGNYDLDDMKRKVQPDSLFEEMGIDSLDMTDFFLRIEDRFQVKIQQEEYANLSSVRRLQTYLANTNGSGPADA